MSRDPFSETPQPERAPSFRYRPRYRLPFERDGKSYLLLVWPDDRYTLHSRGEGEECMDSKSLSAEEADEIICKHVLHSDRSLQAAGLHAAFLKAAEGFRILFEAEHQMAEELKRRERKKG